MAILKSLTISCNEDDDDVNRVGRIRAIVLLHAMMASAEYRLVPFAPTTVGIERLGR